jgi:hypothetical protein
MAVPIGVLMVDDDSVFDAGCEKATDGAGKAVQAETGRQEGGGEVEEAENRKCQQH